MQDLMKIRENQPELFNVIQDKARLLGYIGPNQSLSDVSPVTGDMLDNLIQLEMINYAAKGRGQVELTNYKGGIYMTVTQNEAQRLNEIDKIAAKVPAHLVEKARNDQSITAQKLAYMAIKDEADAIILIDKVTAAINKNPNRGVRV